MDGERVYISVTLVNYLPIQHWLQVARHKDDAYLDSCFVEYNGIKEYLFQYVPCLQCDFCKHSKQVDLINRATLESATWSCPPIAFTLTYDESHLPCVRVNGKRYMIGELRYKDVQDFFKRLRIYWSRHGVKHDIRYLVAGEYGHDRGRPHWHVIMFNNPYQCDELDPLFYKLKEEVFKAWGKCQRQAFDFRQCRGGAAGYATKYVCKPPLMHGHITKPMIRCSSGSRGGLGAILVNKMLGYLRENPQLNYIEYTDNNGCYHYMYFTKSISRRVWPSPSASVPVRSKMLYKQLTDVVICLYSLGYDLSDTLETLRPSKYVRNKFLKPMASPICSTMKRLLISKYLRLFDLLASDLAVLSIDDDDYISNYYKHRESIVANLDISAQKLSKIREKTQLLMSKAKL